jgi:8-oxo-dGTP diphosphatase
MSAGSEAPGKRAESKPASDVPVFGIRVAGRPYVIRPSAYALLRNSKGEVAVVRSADGCFLPGGGADPGESAEQAVLREALEECGFVLRLGEILASAIQFAYSAAENTGFEKQSVFFAATIESVGAATEPGNQLQWLEHSAAIAALSHESHRWAVRDFLKNS